MNRKNLARAAARAASGAGRAARKKDLVPRFLQKARAALERAHEKVAAFALRLAGADAAVLSASAAAEDAAAAVQAGGGRCAASALELAAAAAAAAAEVA